MTKRLNSSYKICNKIKGIYKNIWGVVKSTKFRSIKVLKKDSFSIKLKLKRLSSFSKSLNSRQSLKGFYCNLSEKSFKKLLKKSIESKSKTINKLISFLESRVDLILFRACFVNSLHMARQLISHGFIYINKKQIFSSHISLCTGDVLEIKQNNVFFNAKFKIRHFKEYYNLLDIRKNNNFLSLFIKSLNKKNRVVTPILKEAFSECYRFKKLTLPATNLEINYSLFKIIFLWEPILTNVYYPVPINHRPNLKSQVFSYNEILY